MEPRRLALLFLLACGMASAQPYPPPSWPVVAGPKNLLVAANLCTSRLASAIADVATTNLLVTNSSPSGTCFQANEEVQIDNEFLLITSVGFGQMTVVRGFDNSKPSTHQANAQVTLVWAAMYHNALAGEIIALENFIGNTAGQTTYNQGSPNAISQTVTAKLQQVISFDDFGCLTSNTAGQNNVACQNAIEYASPLGIALSCQGTYPISVPLIMRNGLEIQGRGRGPLSATTAGCTISQTAAVPVFQVPINTGSTVLLKNLRIRGGTDGISMLGGHATNQWTALNYLVTEHVWFSNQSVAGIHMDDYAVIQQWTSIDTNFIGNSSTTIAGLYKTNPSNGNGFLVHWASFNDQFAGSQNAINVDASCCTGGWEFHNITVHSLWQSAIIIAGTAGQIDFYGGSSELVGTSGPTSDGRGAGTAMHTFCSSPAPGSLTITCDDATTILNGQVLNIQNAVVNPVSSSWPGYDGLFTVQSGGGTVGTGPGSVTLTLTSAVPLKLTHADVVNAQYDVFDILPGANGDRPQQINWYGAGFFSGPRYTINNGGRNIGFFGYQLNGMVYDPAGYASPALTLLGSGSGGGYALYRVAIPPTFPLGGFNKSYTGSSLMAVQQSGNPGANGGYMLVSCGDALSNQCSSTGVFGDLFLERADGNIIGRFDYNTGNWLNGNTAVKPPGATNSFTFENGTAPSAGTAGQGTLTSVLGEPIWTNPAGANESVVPFVGKVDLVNQAIVQNNVGLATLPSTGYYTVSYIAKVTQVATTSSALGAGTISGFALQYQQGTDSTSMNPTVPAFNEVNAAIVRSTGNIGNVLTSTSSGSVVIWAKAGGINFYFGYTSVGATPMQYDLHIRVQKVSN